MLSILFLLLLPEYFFIDRTNDDPVFYLSILIYINGTVSPMVMFVKYVKDWMETTITNFETIVLCNTCLGISTMILANKLILASPNS